MREYYFEDPLTRVSTNHGMDTGGHPPPSPEYPQANGLAEECAIRILDQEDP